jgi:hypothetical protein
LLWGWRTTLLIANLKAHEVFFATAGGLIFNGYANRRLRAFDDETGEHCGRKL